MDNLLRKTINISLGKILEVGIAGALLFGGLTGLNEYEKYITIKPEKCDVWGMVNTHERSGGLWEFYMAEKIHYRTKNWAIYQESVAVRNNGKSKGKIFVPDLDGDLSVGLKY